MAEKTVTTKTCDNCGTIAEEIRESRAGLSTQDGRQPGWGKLYWDARLGSEVPGCEESFIATRSMGADLCPECMVPIRAAIPAAEAKEHKFWDSLEASVKGTDQQ